MRKWEDIYPTPEVLLQDLKKVRSAGFKNLGSDRAGYIKKILDAIVGKSCNWSVNQCSRIYVVLLEKYIEVDRLELLLAICGFTEEYQNIRTTSGRRLLYGRTYPEHDLEVSPKTLEKREDAALSGMANLMCLNYEQDANELVNLVTSVLEDEELAELGLLDNVPDTPNDSLASLLHRDDKISNISLSPDDSFVGRASTLETIQTVLSIGKTMVIAGRKGCGKTRVALEYARRTVDYQIICFLDASSPDHLECSALDFFKLLEIPYDPYDDSFPSPPELFQAFFSANHNWLIILDNAKLDHTATVKTIEQYLPSNGHILITTTATALPLKNSKRFILDSFANSKDRNDGVLFLKYILREENLSNEASELLSVCYSDPLALTLTTALMTGTNCLDCNTVIKLLEYYDTSLDGYGLPSSLIAFDILAHKLKVMSQFFAEDDLDRAILKLLVIFGVFRVVDLKYWTVVLPVLPEPIASICVNDAAISKIVKELSRFGLYEITPGKVMSNGSLKSIINYWFDASIKRQVLEELKSNIEQAISNAKKNQYLFNRNTILLNANLSLDLVWEALRDLDMPEDTLLDNIY